MLHRNSKDQFLYTLERMTRIAADCYRSADWRNTVESYCSFLPEERKNFFFFTRDPEIISCTYVFFLWLCFTVLSTLISLFFFHFYFFYYKPFFKYFSNTLLKHLAIINFRIWILSQESTSLTPLTSTFLFIMRLIYSLVKIYNIKFIGSNCFLSSDFFFISVRS